MRPSDRSALLTILVLGVVVPLTIAVVSGVLGLPHNDDFNYRRVALGLYQEGRLELTGWTAMSLIGQVLLVQPFLWLTGGAPWAFGVMTALLAALGLIASYVLVRPMLSSARALLAVLLVVVFPGFLLNTTTFMTDVPAYALEMVCLVLGVPALQRHDPHRWRWLAASLAVGCLAFSIREFALAAPAAVLLAALLGDPRRWPAFVAAGIGVAIVCGAIHQVSASLPGYYGVPLEAPTQFTVEKARQAATTVALAVFPATIIAAGWWWRRWSWAGAAVGFGLGVLTHLDWLASLAGGSVPRTIVGNMLEPEGPLGTIALAGGRPDLFWPFWWDGLNVLALAGMLLLTATVGGVTGPILRRSAARSRLVEWRGAPVGLLLAFAAVYGVGITGFGLVMYSFDRYVWPLTLPIAALLLYRPDGNDRIRDALADARTSRVRRGAILASAYGITLVLAATSYALVVNGHAFDDARWQMGEEAVARGIRPETVDAGFEWVSFHASGTAVPNTAPDRDEMWYDAIWPGFRLCAMVSSSPLAMDGFTLITVRDAAYRTLLFAGPEHPLYLYAVSKPGC